MPTSLSDFAELHVDDHSWSLLHRICMVPCPTKKIKDQVSMNTNDRTQTRLVSFSTPVIHIEVALHRRYNRWYIVYPRAYGMADGWKLFAPLNESQLSDLSTAPPKQSLHHRFWLRECPSVALADLLAATPQILKATGTTRRERRG